MSFEVGIQNAHVEQPDANSGLLLDLKQAVDLPSRVLEFTNCTLGENYIDKFTAVDNEFNMTSRE
jgi:hypothetical protein